MFSSMSPITRKSVKMVAEPCNGTAPWIPDTTGRLDYYSAVAKAVHANKAFMVVAADPLSLIALKPPSEFGSDAVVGWMQWFGVPMWAGGPAAVYLATSLKQVRRMPGRLTGESLDRLGNPTFRLNLQTREQHIRLDKATSNLCTTQVLLANMAAIYAVYQRTDGLKTIAKRVHGVSKLFASELAKLGVALPNGEALFDTVAFDVSPLSSADLVKALEAKHINLRALDPKLVSASFDETHNPEDVHAIIAALREAGVKGTATPAQLAVDGKVSETFARTRPFLQQHIFNFIHSETEMMCYMTMLQHKDLSLTTSMISLGSCTMKLNSVVSLAPCSWPEVMNIHPFAPASNTIGYREVLNSLEAYLVSCTGFNACSLQPTSGASGEYAGLLVIRQETEDVKENRPKGLVIVDIELVAVKSCKGPGSSGWNGWQSIVMETEYGDAWVDKV